MARRAPMRLAALAVVAGALLPATASAGDVSLQAPAAAERGRPVALTLTLPARVAAVEGRIVVGRGAAEVIGVAPARGGTAFRPIPFRAGASFGAYDLRAAGRRTVVRLVLEPRITGRLQLRVVLDAAADRSGRRVALKTTQTRAVVRVGSGQRLLGARPLAAHAVPGPARALRDLVADGQADARDVDAARAQWEQARETASRCGQSAGDANRDGCTDIVDVQAVLAADRAAPDRRRARAADPLTFTVTSPLDLADALPGDGLCATATAVCTLRAAITEADYMQGADRIEFNLPGPAPVLIQISSRLPIISSPANGVTIDGYTQPGAQVNTAAVGSNAIPGVEIRGNGNAAREAVFRISSANNTIRGLLIHNAWRPIVIDGPNAANNAIVGNLLGFLKTGALSARGQWGVLLNAGANHNVIGRPALADRNVIGNHSHAVENYGPGVASNVIQNNVLCMRPSGMATATCDAGIDHNFGPKANLIGGFGPLERNVVGGTNLQAIELSHGWDPAFPPATMNSLEYQINDHRILGNWLGFRGDGSYDPAFRSGLNRSTSDNGNGVNIYDGSNDNLVEGNYIAAVYDGVQLMSPNAHDNTVRGNVIGVSPLGQPAPLTGWGVKVRWSTQRDVIEDNVIANAALGGVGLVQDTVHNIRISRNLVSATNGPAIDLYGVSGPDANDAGDGDSGANTLLNTPVIAAATTASVSGTAAPGSTLQVYRASRPAGQFGLPVAYLGAGTAAGDGSWSVPVALAVGDLVTALQIRPDGNTSELAANVAAGEAPPPPQPGELVGGDDFDRVTSGGWGTASLGGTWSHVGTAGDFSVDGSGRISTAAGQTREARLPASLADLQLVGRLAFDRLPGAGNAFAYVLARQSGTTAYRAAVRVAPSGAVFVQLKRAIANAESAVAPEIATGLTLLPGAPLGFRLRVVGSDLRFRVWDAAGAEPEVWQTAAEDDTAALQGPGGVGLRTFTGGPVPNGPVVVSLDALEIRLP